MVSDWSSANRIFMHPYDDGKNGWPSQTSFKTKVAADAYTVLYEIGRSDGQQEIAEQLTAKKNNAAGEKRKRELNQAGQRKSSMHILLRVGLYLFFYLTLYLFVDQILLKGWLSQKAVPYAIAKMLAIAREGWNLL